MQELYTDDINKPESSSAGQKKGVYLSIFVDIVTYEPNTLFMSLKPPPEGSDELLFGDGAHHPTQAFLRLSWDRWRPASSSFIFLNRKKSAGGR
jgi:hypothetical protein